MLYPWRPRSRPVIGRTDGTWKAAIGREAGSTTRPCGTEQSPADDDSTDAVRAEKKYAKPDVRTEGLGLGRRRRDSFVRARVRERNGGRGAANNRMAWRESIEGSQPPFARFYRGNGYGSLVLAVFSRGRWLCPDTPLFERHHLEEWKRESTLFLSFFFLDIRALVLTKGAKFRSCAPPASSALR